MNSNNISGISIQQEDLDLSDFSTESIEEMKSKKMAAKIKKLEAKLAIHKQTNQAAGGPSMMQMGWQFGEKFGKMEKELEKMAKEMEGIRTENAELKAAHGVDIGALKKEVEKMGQENGQLKKEFGEKNAELEGKINEKDRQMREMEEENAKLGQEVKKLAVELAQKGLAMDRLKEENRKMKEEIGAKNGEFEGQIDGLKKDNGKLGRGLRQILGQKAEKEELTNLACQFDGVKEQCEKLSQDVSEMVEKQTTESANLANLSEKIAKLEASTKFDVIKKGGNKWTQCGPKMAISEGGLVAKHSGPYGWNSIRAQLAIPKFNLNSKKSSISYFEVEIVANHPNSWDIYIGFCTQQFPLDGNLLGNGQNSIGICNKDGIYVDGKENRFGNVGGYFQQKEIIGIGIVHFPAILSMKCFATCNGQLLGKTDLPIKFGNLQLFPAVTMYFANDSIQANFGGDPWQYNPAPEHFVN